MNSCDMVLKLYYCYYSRIKLTRLDPTLATPCMRSTKSSILFSISFFIVCEAETSSSTLVIECVEFCEQFLLRALEPNSEICTHENFRLIRLYCICLTVYMLQCTCILCIYMYMPIHFVCLHFTESSSAETMDHTPTAPPPTLTLQ